MHLPGNRHLLLFGVLALSSGLSLTLWLARMVYSDSRTYFF
jgi:hypothetical protein